MQRRYSKRRKFNTGKGLKPTVIVSFVFLLGLLMIWKANKVKDFYSAANNLEKEKKTLISENSGLNATLMDLKSLSSAGDAVKGRYGLTQNVSGRVYIKSSIGPDAAKDKDLFVDMDKVADWIEDAVFRSGSVTAREKENDSAK